MHNIGAAVVWLWRLMKATVCSRAFWRTDTATQQCVATWPGDIQETRLPQHSHSRDPWGRASLYEKFYSVYERNTW